MHPLQSSSNPAFHRALWFAEKLCHLAVAVAPEIGELDRPPLGLGDLAQGFTHVLGEHDVTDLALDVVRRLRRDAGVALLPAPASRLRAQQVDGSAVGLGEEERA